MPITQWTIEQAITSMEKAARTLPGTFRAEFALRCHGGAVGAAESWSCEVEADIRETTFAAWGQTAQEAIQHGIREAWRRVPPFEGLVEVVPFTTTSWADAAFADWLDLLGIRREQIPPKMIRIDTGRGQDGDIRRYLIVPVAIPE
jgi:hypothetical protein